MFVANYINFDFEVVHPFAGINAIEDILIKKKFLVVQDDQNLFYGILMPFDIVERPHKIVVDCLGKMEKVDVDDTIISAYHKMMSLHRHVLPVFRENTFLGVLNHQRIVYSICNAKTITENRLLETERELEEEKERSRIAEKLKETFLNNISHEIRTPLNGLIGFADIISSSQLSDFQRQDFYKLISKSSKRFLDVIDEIIEFSRIRSGDIKIRKPSVCSAIAIIDELYRYYENEKITLDKSHIAVRVNKYEDDICFSSDCSKIQQVLNYVMHNSLKFTKEGYVEIGFRKDEEYVVFFIRDTGTGIPLEKQSLVFIPFEKVETERENILPGIGLGLSIAKYITNSLDGDICFDSLPGVGSTFYIKFPL